MKKIACNHLLISGYGDPHLPYMNNNVSSGRLFTTGADREGSARNCPVCWTKRQFHTWLSQLSSAWPAHWDYCLLSPNPSCASSAGQEASPPSETLCYRRLTPLAPWSYPTSSSSALFLNWNVSMEQPIPCDPSDRHRPQAANKYSQKDIQASTSTWFLLLSVTVHSYNLIIFFFLQAWLWIQ